MTIVSQPIGPFALGGERHENQTDRHSDGRWVAPAPGRCECASRIRSRPESGWRADLERCAYRGELWAHTDREPDRRDPCRPPSPPAMPRSRLREEQEETALLLGLMK